MGYNSDKLNKLALFELYEEKKKQEEERRRKKTMIANKNIYKSW